MQGESTCWTEIRGAAAGQAAERDAFARRYGAVMRSCLRARWRGTALAAEVDDAMQDVILECLRPGGALTRADERRPGGFRAFLFGVIRNVALRFERKHGQRAEIQAPTSVVHGAGAEAPPDIALAFDRAWARSIMKEAATRQRVLAEELGPAAQRRVELLAKRFNEDLPIRAIAQQWAMDPANLHHEYAQARKEFRRALEDVLAFYHPHSRHEMEKECLALLSLLR
jgi:RNA polymerase sigma-70 factor (ECF subfamily)